jgi:hypothetical protein
MGDTLVQVLGALFLLQGIVRLGFIVNTLLRVAALVPDPYYLVVVQIVPAVLAVLVMIAGVCMLALMRSGRGFALAICGIALAYQLYAFISVVMTLYVIAPAPGRSLGLLFWVLQPAYMALFVAGLIVLIRWRPPELAGR